MGSNRAVFLDRDNTLIDNTGYLWDPQAVRLLPAASESVRRLRGAGYRVVVVTNQSGVARGLFTEGQLAAVHKKMRDLLREAGTDVDAVYSCPFLETDEAVVEAYRKDSDLRKPKPGMLLMAAKDLNLDLAACWMIGDAKRDIQAGKAAGCRTIRVGGGGDGIAADHVAADLRAATDHVVARRPSEAEEDRTAPAGAGAGKKAGVAPELKLGAPTAEALLMQVVDELRTLRRETRHSDFSMGKLVGSIAQSFAVCALGWGLFAAMEMGGTNPNAANDAVIRLLAAMAFQLIALTAFVSGRR